jgi:hypothetical protein
VVRRELLPLERAEAVAAGYNPASLTALWNIKYFHRVTWLTRSAARLEGLVARAWTAHTKGSVVRATTRRTLSNAASPAQLFVQRAVYWPGLLREGGTVSLVPNASADQRR